MGLRRGRGPPGGVVGCRGVGLKGRVDTPGVPVPAARERWQPLIHDCSNRTKFARDLNLRAHEGGWFGASSYGCEFARLPYAAFLPILRDPDFQFLEEEPLPEGYRPGDIVL